jgi:hypothetical protein
MGYNQGRSIKLGSNLYKITELTFAVADWGSVDAAYKAANAAFALRVRRRNTDPNPTIKASATPAGCFDKNPSHQILEYYGLRLHPHTIVGGAGVDAWVVRSLEAGDDVGRRVRRMTPTGESTVRFK